MTTPTLEIGYHELIKETAPISALAACDFLQRKVEHTEVGSYNERTLSIGHVRINEVNTSFRRACKISVHDNFLADSLHLCLPLDGTLSGKFQDSGITATLKPKSHHYIFTPGYEYELEFDREVRLAHVEFGLPYFASLLCPNEQWSAALQEKFVKQQVIWSGGTLVCKTTNDIIHSILNCPFTGSLRKIFLEAKVVELVALQLDHYRSMGAVVAKPLKRTEEDLMFQVREFLLANLTDDHSLKSIALHFGINEFKLKRNFKLQFGQTVFDFLFDQKMDHAYHLLRDGGMFVNEVARHIGYKNPNHFTTAFSKKFGMNPSRLKG